MVYLAMSDIAVLGNGAGEATSLLPSPGANLGSLLTLDT